MRFSHAADCHLGGHRDPRLRQMGERAFEQFITESLNEKVDFILIAGDLFNTAIPGIDALKTAVTHLGRAKEAGIPVYAIAGSHDFSPSGKTMLDVLERAGLLVNVAKGETIDGNLRLLYSKDEKTGAQFAGIPGLRSVLDRRMYEQLDHDVQAPQHGIFLFHTPLVELGTSIDMGGQLLSVLPKGFRYYAGGHVHTRNHYQDESYPHVVYPGPLFPNSFSELETLQHGGYVLVDGENITFRTLMLAPVHPLKIGVEGKSSSEAAQHIRETAALLDPNGAIVTLRVFGTLADGDQADLDLRAVAASLEKRGAIAVLRNTARLQSPGFTIAHHGAEEAYDVEASALAQHKEHLAIDGGDGVELAKVLIQALGREPKEGEKLYEYRDMIVQQAMELLQTHSRN